VSNLRKPHFRRYIIHGRTCDAEIFESCQPHNVRIKLALIVSPFDRIFCGDLYVSTPSDVEVSKTGSRSPSLIITSGVDDADHIAIGASGNLYVSNVAGLRCGSVSIYKLGAKEPSYTI
jgi:hypothetical protein